MFMSNLRYLLRYVGIVVSNTCYVVFLFCLSTSCVPYVALNCSYLIGPSVFSNVYFLFFIRRDLLSKNKNGIKT